MRPVVSILLVNYHSENEIQDLILKIEKSCDDFEVIIVDNSNTFPRDLYRTEQNISLIGNPDGNSGFGRAMNLAADAAQSDTLCLLNPDIIFDDPKVLMDLVARLRELPPEVGAVGCLVQYPDGTPQHSAIKGSSQGSFQFFKQQFFVNLPRSIRQRRQASVQKENENNTSVAETSRPVMGFYASFVLIRSDAFRKTGGFDPDFFMYCEDTEFFRRRFSRKWRSIQFTDLSVVHKSRQSDIFGLMEKQNVVSYLLYLWKMSPSWLVIHLLFSIPRSLVLLFFSEHRQEGMLRLSSLRYLPVILTRGGLGKPERKPVKISEVRD